MVFTKQKAFEILITSSYFLCCSQIVSIIIRQLPEVVFVSRDQTLSIVNVNSCEKLKVLPLYEPIEAAVFVSGSLFTVGEEGVLKCWNMKNAKLLKSASIYGYVLIFGFTIKLVLVFVIASYYSFCSV